MIHEAKTTRKNSYAKSAVENGLTTQLTNRVMTSPVGGTPTYRIEAKSTFIIIGTIIGQMARRSAD